MTENSEDTTPTIDPADIELAGEAERKSGDPAPPENAPIEATAEFPVLSLRDITLMADPRNASSPMATDGPGVSDDHGAPEHGSGAPIPWPFSN